MQRPKFVHWDFVFQLAGWKPVAGTKYQTFVLVFYRRETEFPAPK